MLSLHTAELTACRRSPENLPPSMCCVVLCNSFFIESLRWVVCVDEVVGDAAGLSGLADDLSWWWGGHVPDSARRAGNRDNDNATGTLQHIYSEISCSECKACDNCVFMYTALQTFLQVLQLFM